MERDFYSNVFNMQKDFLVIFGKKKDFSEPLVFLFETVIVSSREM